MVSLNLQMLKRLDKALRTEYHSWVETAPSAYKEDKFFQERVPIIVTSSYGQNQRIGLKPGEERENWQRDRDFSKVRFMTVALATHLW